MTIRINLNENKYLFNLIKVIYHIFIMESVVASVNLVDCRQMAIIPFRNIDKLSTRDAFNRSFNRNKKYKIFWSNDFDKVPDFTLPNSKAFQRNVDACFEAKIVLTYGKRWFFYLFKELYSDIIFCLDSLNEAKTQLHAAYAIPISLNSSQVHNSDGNSSGIRQDNTPPMSPIVDHPNESSVNSSHSVEIDDDWQANTPPMSPLIDHSDESNAMTEDLICLSNSTDFDTHRPRIDWDSLCGSRPFEVMVRDYYFTVVSLSFLHLKHIQLF